MWKIAFVVALFIAPSHGFAQGLGGSLGDPSAEPGEWVPAPGATYRVQAPDGALAVPAAPGSAEDAAERHVAERLRALDTTYSMLASSSGPNWLNIIFSMVGGAASIGIGIAALELGAPELAPYLITLGSATILRTVVADIILTPDPRGASLEYQHMPMERPADRMARLRYGEEQLHALAEMSFIARIVGASINIAGALAVIPAYLLVNDPSTIQPLEALIFIGPALSLVMAIVTLASPSAVEQRRDAYVQMRNRLEERDRTANRGVSLGVSTAIDPRGGGALVLTGRF